MNKEETWEAVLSEIEVKISKPNFLTWLKNSELLKKEENGGKAIVGLPNNFAKEWVQKRYHKLILGSLRDIDSSIKKVDYVVVDSNKQKTPPKEKNKNKKKKKPPKEVMEDRQSSLIDVEVDPKTNLNPVYTIESFVVGPSNELAHAAVKAVTEQVGTKYNPLFIYGKVGLGKTHLLQAAGNKIKNDYSDVNVLYVTSKKFTNDVVGAIRNKRMEDIKKKYRKVDVLIIDDIQFIGGKTATEQEFFYTFNTLYEQNKQIIISSDRPPAAIPTLEERLRSRFEGGMVADISYPDYEMRLAILKNKAQMNNWNVEEKILEIIASKIQRNIRELEGVLNKVVFYQDFKEQKIDEDKLEEIINEASQISAQNVGADDIMETVTDFFDITEDKLISKSRKKEVVKPRQICMYLMREILDLSYPNIGEKIGDRDHTTVIHACEKIEEKFRKDSNLNQDIMLIKERLLE